MAKKKKLKKQDRQLIIVLGIAGLFVMALLIGASLRT